ncbi:MAG: hypothetical protein JJE30_17405 [Desulfuromonadales bacterium]|nr:hypothetical protein [Desulfuromonadales bacterium]
MPAAINWNGDTKLKRIQTLTEVLLLHEIENEYDLLRWLDDANNKKVLMQLDGIGPKTVNYIHRLVGGQAIPIDRHLRKLADSTGLHFHSYDEMERVFKFSADLLGKDYVTFDRSVWSYYANGRGGNTETQIPLVF